MEALSNLVPQQIHVSNHVTLYNATCLIHLNKAGKNNNKKEPKNHGGRGAGTLYSLKAHLVILTPDQVEATRTWAPPCGVTAPRGPDAGIAAPALRALRDEAPLLLKRPAQETPPQLTSIWFPGALLAGPSPTPKPHGAPQSTPAPLLPSQLRVSPSPLLLRL